ncbi:MAG: hypothetical protein IKR48_07445, partial [Kiritimatiellae bacterium]|nr:hypothetical protein [Kiritimatiellia bacterium]
LSIATECYRRMGGTRSVASDCVTTFSSSKPKELFPMNILALDAGRLPPPSFVTRHSSLVILSFVIGGLPPPSFFIFLFSFFTGSDARPTRILYSFIQSNNRALKHLGIEIQPNEPA